jgi:hypothetical protein
MTKKPSFSKTIGLSIHLRLSSPLSHRLSLPVSHNHNQRPNENPPNLASKNSTSSSVPVQLEAERS